MRIPGALCVVAVMACLLFGGLGVPAEAAPAARTLIVLDASGSMAAMAGAQTRMTIARGVVTQLVQNWNPALPLGLMAYGHRRKNDCSDIELLAPPGPIDRPAILASVQRLSAKGMTPLGASLQQAASALGYGPGGKRIVLVTDGLEDCHADPCAIAKGLHDHDVDLQIDVIGFNAETGSSKQLQCIADAGGGSYHATSDAKSLIGALTEAATGAADVKPAVESQQPAAEPQRPTVVPPPVHHAPIDFSAVEVVAGAPVTVSLDWTVTRKGEASPVYTGGGAHVAPELDAGEYQVTARGDNVSASATIKVAGDPGEAHTLALNAGRLSLAAIAATDQPEIEGDGAIGWTVKPLDAEPRPAVPPGAKPTMLLAAGRYHIEAAANGLTATKDVTVTAGKDERQILDLKAGTLVLEAATDPDGPAVSDWRDATWSLTAAAGGPLPRLDPAALASARPTLLLSAGSYTVGLKFSGATLGGRATVVEGKTTVHRVILPAASITLTAALGPGGDVLADWRDAQWTVEAIDAIGTKPGDKPADAQAVAQLSLKLAPGKWRIALVSGAASTEQHLTLAPGATEAVRFDLEAGRLVMSATVPDGAPASANVVYTVTALSADGSPGQRVYQGGSSEGLSTVVPSGRYRIDAADDQNRTASSTLDLSVGEELPVNLQLK